jgi:hypothetical protein
MSMPTVKMSPAGPLIGILCKEMDRRSRGHGARSDSGRSSQAVHVDRILSVLFQKARD